MGNNRTQTVTLPVTNPEAISLIDPNLKEILESNLFNCYSQYRGNKSAGCINFWIYVYCGLLHAENCCFQQDKTVTYSPYNKERIANSVTWVEDKPMEFRPRFDFAPGFKHAAELQDAYEALCIPNT